MNLILSVKIYSLQKANFYHTVWRNDYVYAVTGHKNWFIMLGEFLSGIYCTSWGLAIYFLKIYFKDKCIHTQKQKMCT